MMKILTSFFSEEAEIGAEKRWKNCFYGEALDARGSAIIEFFKKRCDNHFKIQYNPSEFTVSINNEVIQRDDLDEYFAKFDWSSTIIDSTTIGFVELLFSVKNALEKCSQFDVVYLQPERYKKKDNSTLLHKREFDISEEMPGYQAIPGYSSLLQSDESNHYVFFTGYEPIRLDRAFEDYQMIKSDNCNIVFGLPAYKAGWENDAFSNNINILASRNISAEIAYCGATNPLASYDLLSEIRKSLDVNTTMIVAPIGPKPLAIGAALFIGTSGSSGVSVLYDHPINKAARTESIAKWFFYTVVNS